MKVGVDYDPLAMTFDQSREWSTRMTDLLQQNSTESSKEAAMSMNDYVRPVNHESSFVSKILTPGGWDESERVLDRITDQPQLLIEIEPDSAGAEAVDFGHLAETFYPYGKRVPMTMTQVDTQRIVKNVIELGAYKYNFRTVLTDLLSLKLAYLRDSRFMTAAGRCLAGVGNPLSYTGKTNNTAAGADFSYAGYQKAINVMRGQPNAIEPATVVFSHIMIALMKSALVEDFPGTKVATDIYYNGLTELESDGDNIRKIATNKQDIVPAGQYTFFGPENQLGRYVQMIEPTMLVENRGTKISLQLYEVLGMIIVNQAAVSRTTFTIS